jgi:coenzyme PQQ biosynthesis protein PqqD
MAMPMANGSRPRLSRGVRLQIDGTTGKGVLLFPEGILELNETAQAILARCDGRPLYSIVAELAEEYGTDVATVLGDARETLGELQERRLIEFA